MRISAWSSYVVSSDLCGPRRRFVVRGSSGPFIVHNCVMGVEVDIQRFGSRLLAAHGYPMVLGVYDEDVCEIRPAKPLSLGLPRVEGLDPHVQEIEHQIGRESGRERVVQYVENL